MPRCRPLAPAPASAYRLLLNHRKETAMNQPPKDKDLQGEGNYDASRRYDQAAHEFAQSGQVDDAARKARPTTEQEADELRRAEREAASHSKGEDPAT
jgi:hypothetical protein